jgi:hypothetical protein
VPVPVSQASADPGLRAAVEADWTAQERRRGRTPERPEAVLEAAQRADRLVTDLSGRPGGPDVRSEEAELRRLEPAVRRAASLTARERQDLYAGLRWTGRSAALKNPLVAGQPIAFLKRRRFISQMLHEYLGYFCDSGDVAGGGVFALEEPGRSLRARDLLRGRLPRGNYTTLAASYAAATLYFGFAERAAEKPGYYTPDRRCFHLFALGADGADLRQLTDGPHDDFDWYEWGGQSIAQAVTRPGRGGADESRLLPVLADAAHRGKVRLAPDELQRLVVWLDANAPFYGVYGEQEQLAQRRGELVAPPKVQ